MLVFLFILILLAVLGVLGLALKIAAALVLGVVIATVTIVAIGYYAIRHQMRKIERSMPAPRPTAGELGGTTVEVGDPRRTMDQPDVDDRY